MIEEAWRQYKKATIHEDASYEQILDLKKAFIAGIFWMMELNKHMADSATEDEACILLEKVDNELITVIERLKQDRL